MRKYEKPMLEIITLISDTAIASDECVTIYVTETLDAWDIGKRWSDDGHTYYECIG